MSTIYKCYRYHRVHDIVSRNINDSNDVADLVTKIQVFVINPIPIGYDRQLRGYSIVEWGFLFEPDGMNRTHTTPAFPNDFKKDLE
jgi:hypothetical protein